MAQNNNILNELRSLESSLPASTPGNIYSVPAGYFEGLLGEVMMRIKALEATSPDEELGLLSPYLQSISREMPFHIPGKYFAELDITVPMVSDKADEELGTISPLLAGLKKEMPYEVPQGYFENLGTSSPETQPAKVIRLTARKWFRYAAAAVVAAVILTGGFFIWQKNANMEAMTLAKYEKKLNKEIRKMSDTELDEFIQYTDSGLSGDENASVNSNDEVKELLKDIPENELKEFIEETSDLQTEPTLLN